MLRLNHVFLVPGQDYMGFIIERPIIKLCNLVITDCKIKYFVWLLKMKLLYINLLYINLLYVNNLIYLVIKNIDLNICLKNYCF